jgi:hypothetical protein
LFSKTDKGEASKYVRLINSGRLEGAGDTMAAEALVKLRGLGATVHETHYSAVDQST